MGLLDYLGHNDKRDKTFASKENAIQFILEDIDQRKPILDKPNCRFKCPKVEFSYENCSNGIMEKLVDTGIKKKDPGLMSGLAALVEEINEAKSCQVTMSPDKPLELTTPANLIPEGSSQIPSHEGSGLSSGIEHEAEFKAVPGLDESSINLNNGDSRLSSTSSSTSNWTTSNCNAYNPACQLTMAEVKPLDQGAATPANLFEKGLDAIFERLAKKMNKMKLGPEDQPKSFSFIP